MESIKQQGRKMRDSLQQGIYFIINPLVRLLIKIGITPNMVTFIGFAGNLIAAVVIVYAARMSVGASIDWNLITLGGCLIIAFSLFDMLDGQVARLGNMSSTFGAFFDSVLDRYCEFLTVGSIAYLLLRQGWEWAALLTYLALMGSLLVSYTRARGEGLGVVCKIGFMQRPERVVLTALALIATGITGNLVKGDFNPLWITAIAMAIMAIFTNMTALARINYLRKRLK